jgi:hypothetical protein
MTLEIHPLPASRLVVAQPIEVATNHKMQGQSAWAMTGLIEPQPISPLLLRELAMGPSVICMCGAGMRYTILLVCADKMFLDTRSLVLETAGYRTLRASDSHERSRAGILLQCGHHQYHFFRRSTGGIRHASTREESQNFSSPSGYKGDSTRIVGGNGQESTSSWVTH